MIWRTFPCHRADDRMLFSCFGSVVILAVISITDGTNEEKRLYEQLFATYHPEIRPVAHPSHALELVIEMELLQIKNVDEKNQVLNTVVILQAQWFDDYLKWNSSDFGDLSELVVSPKRVWLPDFGIENSADTFYHTSYFNDFRVDLHETGRVIWAFGGSVSTVCELDMEFYPFDYQACSIKVENWAYTKRAVAMRNASAHVHLDKYHTNGVWDLLETHVSVADVYYEIYPGLAFPEMTFELILQRKSLYYVVNLILPCLFILSMALLVFWLPPDSGEKVSLGVTALLAFSVFQLVINDNTPANSDKTPILSMFVMFTMGMSALSVFSSILVLHLHHKGAHKPVPRWIRLLAFKVLANLMCMRSILAANKHMNLRRSSFIMASNADHPEKRNESLKSIDKLRLVANHLPTSQKNDNGTRPPQSTEKEELLLHLRFITQYIASQEAHSTINEEWKMIAQVLDRLLFIICSVVIFAVVLWLLMQRGGPPVPHHLQTATPEVVTSDASYLDTGSTQGP